MRTKAQRTEYSKFQQWKHSHHTMRWQVEKENKKGSKFVVEKKVIGRSTKDIVLYHNHFGQAHSYSTSLTTHDPFKGTIQDILPSISWSVSTNLTTSFHVISKFRPNNASSLSVMNSFKFKSSSRVSLTLVFALYAGSDQEVRKLLGNKQAQIQWRNTIFSTCYPVFKNNTTHTNITQRNELE